MFEISVTGRFDAAHGLRRPEGTHEPQHGHRWRVTVTLAGAELDETGVLLDFSLIQQRLNDLLATLNGRNLNELVAFADKGPSAENVAVHVAGHLGRDLPSGVRLRCVEVAESPGCVARYFPTSS